MIAAGGSRGRRLVVALRCGVVPAPRPNDLTRVGGQLRLMRETCSPSSAAMSRPSHEVTELLVAVAEDRPGARDALFAFVYTELKTLAAAQLRRERQEQTLGATALVHETWLRIADRESLGIHGRTHFFATAAQAMRRILVEQARRRHALRRSHEAVVSLDDAIVPGRAPDENDDVLAVHEALDRLVLVDPRQASLVEYRYFAGFSIEEAAALLGISPATAKRDWVMARAWLQRELSAEP